MSSRRVRPALQYASWYGSSRSGSPHNAMPLDFTIKTDAYEGPLALVLDLIEARKLLVNDLALGEITDDFVTHVRSQETFPVEETAEFIGIAETLLHIKSKSLLPDLALTEEEN